MGYSSEQKELLDAVQIMIDNTLNTQVTRIYSCIVTGIGINNCTITLNGQTHSVQYYGGTPTINQQYRLFVPFNNMAQAFIISGGDSSGGGGTDDYSQLINKPSINSIALSGNKTSSDLGLYGAGNEPNYPVSSVNGETGVVEIDIPDKTSDLTNDSGFITSAQAPVQSVNGKTGVVSLTKSDVGLSNVDNVRQYSSSNPPPYPVSSVNGQTGPVSLSIPTKTSDLTNDSKFLPVTQTSPTNGQIVVFDGVKWVNQNPATYIQQQANWAETDNGSVQFIQNKPTALSQFNNDEGFISSSEAPVQSVNGATGAVTITNITGNAATATKATQDGNGSIITTTYAKLASPTFTGTPKAPTATAGTNTTQIATTAFVTSAVSSAGGNVTYLSATAPTSPKTGDTWYRIL